jgi:hypothetical protein
MFMLSAVAEQHIFSGIVSNIDDHPVKEETVEIQTGGAYTTSQRGEFTFPASGNIDVNSEVLFHVRNWVVLKPCELRNGRMYLPPPNRNIDIIVVGPRDPRLRVLAAAQELMGCLVEEAVSRFDISLARQGAARTPDQDKFVASKAAEFVIPQDELESAISRWLAMAHDDYDQGLADLYLGQYAKAKDLIGGSIVPSNRQLVLKRYVPLARAKYGLGDVEGARADLNRVRSEHPTDSIVQRDLGIISQVGPPGGVTATVQ